MADFMNEAKPADPEQEYQISELARFDGRNGRRKLIADQGLVHDVTNCPKWRGERHEQLHFPTQDLTGELAEAPHGEEVFHHPCAKRVGRPAASRPPA
jgi:predicted heme/steroid binding protein